MTESNEAHIVSDLFDDLKQLTEMRDAGDITESEYETVKAELLAETQSMGAETGNQRDDEPFEQPPSRRPAGLTSRDLTKTEGFLFVISIIVVAIIVVLGADRFFGGDDTESAPQPSALLEIALFDNTEANPPNGARVVVEDASWSPDLEFGGDNHAFKPFPAGVSNSFLIYPDGPDAPAIEVIFVMTDEMVPISGSPQALTIVEINDREVIVSGMAIRDFEQTYDR